MVEVNTDVVKGLPVNNRFPPVRASYHFTIAPVVIPPAVTIAVVPEQILVFVIVGAPGPITVTVLVLVNEQLLGTAKPLFQV